MDIDLPGDGVRLGATRWPGAGSVPVVLLHGLSSQRRFWNLVVPHLEGIPLLAVDQRGHGDAEKPSEGYALSTVAGDLAIALDALGWSRVVVVGHSWGGAVAATFAAEHPHRTLALVGIDGGFNSPPPGFDRAAAMRQLEPPRIALPPDELTDMLRAHAPAAWSQELAAAVLPIFEVGDDGLARARLAFETHMRIVETILDYDSGSTLARVRCPTWLVSCEGHDATAAWTTAKAEALARLSPSPHIRAMRWGGAVHDVLLQWPALVAGLIRAAVEELA